MRSLVRPLWSVLLVRGCFVVFDLFGLDIILIEFKGSTSRKGLNEVIKYGVGIDWKLD